MEKITVIGAGNGGHALAFHLSQKGHKVLLYEHPDFAAHLEGIETKGGIEAIEGLERNGHKIAAQMSGFAKIHSLTTDMKAAVNFSDILLMIVPSFAQEPLFSLAMPHLREGQILVLLPGNFGTLVFKRMMKEAGMDQRVIFAEANTIPYACRATAPGEVFILAMKQGLDFATLPGNAIARIGDRLQEILPLKLFLLENVLEAGLGNANMIVHPATAVLNMGLAESRQGAFYFYKEGMSESVSKVQQKIDDERLEIARALDLQAAPFIETVKTFYNLDVKSIKDFAETSPIHSSFGHDGPTNPRHRYISEDCPYLLVPLYGFGKLLGVETPAIESIIRIASIYNDTDYLTQGRTLESLGLSGMDKGQILEHLNLY